MMKCVTAAACVHYYHLTLCVCEAFRNICRFQLRPVYALSAHLHDTVYTHALKFGHPGEKSGCHVFICCRFALIASKVKRKQKPAFPPSVVLLD